MVTTMKRLDQGHLHPKLEVPGLTCPGLHGGREHSRKEHVISYFEHATTEIYVPRASTILYSVYRLL